MSIMSTYLEYLQLKISSLQEKTLSVQLKLEVQLFELERMHFLIARLYVKSESMIQFCLLELTHFLVVLCCHPPDFQTTSLKFRSAVSKNVNS